MLCTVCYAIIVLCTLYIPIYGCSVQIDSHGSPFYEMSALLLHN